MKKTWIYAILLLLSLAMLQAETTLHEVLPNGMEVLVRENFSQESVALYCFVKTGSINEGEYLGAGISHFLEHVVSGGTTEKRTEDEYSAAGRRMGALVNAFTYYYVTAYHIMVDKQYTGEALEILSEQMQYNVCDSMEVAREREVILKEIIMRSTPPMSKFRQRFQELLYPDSNLRYPVIGYTELFRTITRDKLYDYYKKRYVPNNMIFVAAGNFEADEMMSQIRSAFDGFKRGQLKPPYQPPQMPREGDLRFIEEYDLQQSMAAVGYVLPPEAFHDNAALDVALEYLFLKKESPIRKALLEDLNLVNYVYARPSFETNLTEPVVQVMFESAEEENLPRALEVIDEYFDRFATETIDESELERIVTSVKKGLLLSSPTPERDCQSLGFTMIQGNRTVDFLDVYLKSLEAVTVEDVRRVIARWLAPRNRVVHFGVPQGGKQKLEEKSDVAVESNDPQRFELDGDVTLIFRRNTRKPVVQGHLAIPLSTRYETAETKGQLEYMVDLMLSGSEDWDPVRLNQWMEDNSASLYASTGIWGTRISFRCHREDLETMQDILVDAIENPVFPEQEIELARKGAESSYKRSLSRGSARHQEFLRMQVFTDARDRLTDLEETENLIALDRDQLKALHRQYFRSDTILLTVFGDTTQDMAEQLAEAFRDAVPDKAFPGKPAVSGTKITPGRQVQEYQLEEVNVSVLYPAPYRDDSDYYAMMVIEHILSGPRGRLHEATRGSNDLAYFAYPDYEYTVDPGYLELRSQTSLEKVDELIQVMRNETERIGRGEITQEEVNAAIEERIKMMRSLMSDRLLSSWMTYWEMSGRGWDYIYRIEDVLKKVSMEDIQRVADEYLHDPAIFVSRPSEDVQRMVDEADEHTK